MVMRSGRIAMLWSATHMLAAILTPTAQVAVFAKPSERDLPPTGSFAFEPGAIHPTYMDAFGDRPVVKSPDGKLGVTVTGPKESYAAWVTISLAAFPEGSIQVWPIQASVDVLWRPDSQAFALTDMRNANRSYVLVCGTDFRMEDNGEGLGVPITDLTSAIENAFQKIPQEYYAGQSFDTPQFFAMVLRWTGNEQLLVGVSAQTSGPGTFPDRGIKEWNVAYLIDVPSRKVLHVVDKERLLSEYRIKVTE